MWIYLRFILSNYVINKDIILLVKLVLVVIIFEVFVGSKVYDCCIWWEVLDVVSMCLYFNNWFWERNVSIIRDLL